MELSEEDVCETATHVWNSALGMKLTQSHQLSGFSPSDTIVSSVRFEGGFDGSLLLECTRDFASQMAVIMFASENRDVTDEDMEDALREMTNIAAGGLKAKVPGTTRMSLPRICEEVEWEMTRARKPQVLGFECDGSQLNIVVDGCTVESDSEAIRVLLVEDSRAARRMISSSLEDVKNLHFELQCCESLAEALDIAATSQFDVVLLDLTLRDSTGLTTCVQLHQRAPALPIVVLTSSDDETFALDALKAGAQDYLLKAEVSPSLLTRTIKYAIDRSQAEADRKQLQQQLVDASRQAGIAEMATGVLHNVGNTLNGVNISTVLIRDGLSRFSVDKLMQLSQVVSEHRDDLPSFVTEDERGRLLPDVIDLLVTQIRDQRDALETEVGDLLRNVAHIKEVVSAQQAMARPSGVQVMVDLRDVIEQALATRQHTLDVAQITVVREYDDVPVVWVDQHRVLQILGNLIKNAVESICEFQGPESTLTLRLDHIDQNMMRIEVEDTGKGIADEDNARLFQHGFTTKHDGHGFGLHSSANAASEIDGTLTAFSDGPGRGATFRLDLTVSTGSEQPLAESSANAV